MRARVHKHTHTYSCSMCRDEIPEFKTGKFFVTCIGFYIAGFPS